MYSVDNILNKFEHKQKRVKPGEVISRYELARRLANELNISIVLAKQVQNAYRAVLHDALVHGEGVEPTGAYRILLKPSSHKVYKDWNGNVCKKRGHYVLKLDKSKQVTKLIEHVEVPSD